MAERTFTITELRREGDGGFVDTPIKFEWTAAGKSVPRGTWRFGVEQRTVREDYPGSEEPVEQVLGFNFTNEPIAGVWDDRYNTPGFALQTMRAMEALVQRGSMVRLEFESLTIHGIIKKADFDYKRPDYIGYSLNFSPHYRVLGSSARPGPGRKRTPEGLKSPREYRDLCGPLVNLLHEKANAEPAQYVTLTSEAVPTLKQRVAAIMTAFNDLVAAINQRIAPKVEEFEALKRVASCLSVIKGQAAGLMTDLASAKSSTMVAWDDAKAVIEFDDWTRSMKAYARTLALTSWEGSEELSRRVQPKAIALYYPSARESLYGISLRFYGTPSAWKLIADRNNLQTLMLTGTEALIIPERR